MTQAPLSSWNGQLPAGVLLDSGILYIGTSIFAAQDGGLKFDPAKTMRQIAFDGQRSAVKGLDRTTGFMPKISGTIIQTPFSTFESLEPGAVLATVAGGPTGATQVQPKSAGVLYAAGDYLANVKAVWNVADGTLFQIRFPAALVVKWDITGVDKVEAKWAIEIEARLDMAASGAHVYDAPYVAEYAPALT